MISRKPEIEPAEEPVSLIEAKIHLRLIVGEISPEETHPDDDLVSRYIKAARKWAENFQHRSYVTQTWKMFLNEFPSEKNYIEIPKPPLQSITSLTYKTSEDVSATISFVDPSGGISFETDDFIVDIDREPGRLWLKSISSWPTSIVTAKAVEIEFVCGYGDADEVPEDVKTAILLKLTSVYENRGDVEVGDGYDKAARSFLWHDKVIAV